MAIIDHDLVLVEIYDIADAGEIFTILLKDGFEPCFQFLVISNPSLMELGVRIAGIEQSTTLSRWGHIPDMQSRVRTDSFSRHHGRQVVSQLMLYGIRTRK